MVAAPGDGDATPGEDSNRLTNYMMQKGEGVSMKLDTPSRTHTIM